MTYDATPRSPEQLGSSFNRRGFLRSSGTAAAGLTLSTAFPWPLSAAANSAAANSPATNSAAASNLTAWLHVGIDDVITVFVPSSEMGQGVTTALPMLLAEELEADWSTIRVEFAPAAPAYINPRLRQQGTYGSAAIRGFFDPLRQAGATAREMLRQAAAQQWNVPLTECRAANGSITHASGRSATYGALAEAASRVPAPTDIRLKPRAEWRLIGKATPRLDTPFKVDGSARFGIDTRLPDMLVATIAACPIFGGTLKSVDVAPALAVKGVRHVVRLHNAVAVVAEGYWQAHKGLMALSPEWDEGPNARLDNGRIASILAEGLTAEGAVAESHGDVGGALRASARTIEATYSLPLLAHAAMEPIAVTAVVSADGCEIWAPTQGQSVAQLVAARVAGLQPDQVKIHTTYLGGGFGRKSDMDFIVQVVQIAKEVGRPVKLVWSREEDMQHDFYRPAAMARMRAGLDAAGTVTAWDVKLASPSIMSRMVPAVVKDGLDPTSVEGLIRSPYGFANRRVEYVLKDVGVPVGVWRSVGNSVSGFLNEVFMDELARAAGQDPLAFRRALLADQPRHRAVLDRLATMSKWSEPAPPDRHRGMAMHECFGSIVAESIEISQIDGQLRIHGIDCVVDCGIAVNPATIVTQMEGGIIYGLTAALYGEIDIRRGRVEQANFDSYRMLELAQSPRIAVSIIESAEPPGGAGEPSTPPIGPALVNAIFAATGQRLRSLPVGRHGFNLAS